MTEGERMEKIGFMVGHKDYSAHAALLAQSIFKHTELGRDASVCVMTPEHIGLDPDIPNVALMEYAVPEPFRKIPFADKMLAAAAFEAACGGGYLWMDVDSFFFKNPLFSVDAGLFVNPVDKRNIGDLYGEARSRLWLTLYDYFKIAPDSGCGPVHATASGERIYPYFNAGMVLARENRGLFQTVREALYELLERPDVMEMLNGSFPNKVFFHQAAFTCAVLKKYCADETGRLPRGANYPLHLHESHADPIPLEELVSIRYDDYFENHCVPPIWTEHFAAAKDMLQTTWYYH